MPRKIFYGKTDIGLKRENNEDEFFVSPELDFCLAADGMGGAAAGEIASMIFAETAQRVFSGNTDRSEKEILNRVQKSFDSANKKVLEHVVYHPGHKGMGCTAELLAFSEAGFVLGHIGDSRTYRLRNRQLEQLTQDHSLVQQQLDEGLISADKIKHHPLRNVIFRAVGIGDTLDVDLIKGETFSEDLFLLCSDGLTDMIQDDQIRDILCSGIDIYHKAEELVEEAKKAGGEDNITVVLAAID
jgi:serine/threonine protein phosphatase PrpC